MPMSKVYEDKDFLIFYNLDKYTKNRDSAYVLYNKHKNFENGHTHIYNYSTTLWIMRLYTNRKLPLHLRSEYLLNSLIRISNDEYYTQKVKTLLETRKHKGKQRYFNSQKGSANKRKR